MSLSVFSEACICVFLDNYICVAGIISGSEVVAGAEAGLTEEVSGTAEADTTSQRYFGLEATPVVSRLRPSPISKAVVHPAIPMSMGSKRYRFFILLLQGFQAINNGQAV